MTWIRKHRLRAAIYAVLAAAIALAAARAGELASWMVNGPAGRAAARRFGISFHAAEFRLRTGGAEIARLTAELETAPPVHLAAGRLRLEGLRQIRAERIRFGETLTINQAAIDAVRQAAEFSGIGFGKVLRVAEAGAKLAPLQFDARSISAPGIRLGSAAAGGVVIAQDRVRAGEVQAADLQVLAERAASGRWNLEDAAALAAPARQLAREVSALGPFYARLVGRLRGLLGWAILAAVLVIAAAKLLLTHGRIAVKAASAAAVLAPLLLAPWFSVYVVLAAIAAAALVLLLSVYRKAPGWHQKLEPLAVDLTGPVLAAALLFAYFFPYPPPPAIPGAVQIDRAGLKGISAAIIAGGARIQLNSTSVAADGILLAETVHVSRVFAPDTSVRGEGWRVVLKDVEAANVKAAGGSGSVEKVAFGGEAESDLVSRRLARYEYLPDEWKRTLRAAFTGTASAGGPPVRYRAQASVTAEAVGLSFDASGDADTIRLARIRTSTPSALRIEDGSAEIRLAGNRASKLHLTRLAAGRVRAGALDVTLGPGRAGARVHVLELPDARIDELLSEAGFRQGRFSAEATARNAAYRSPDAALSGDVPLASARVSGVWKNDEVSGEIRLSSSRFALAGPLRFSMDLASGALRVPAQSIAISQSAIPRAPESVAAELGFTSRLHKKGAGLEARVRIPSFSPEVQPLGLEFTDVDIVASLHPGRREFRVETGWNRIRYPSVPRPRRLESVERLRLDLSLEGDWMSPELLDGWRAPAGAALPERFRITGAWPDLQVLPESQAPQALDGLTAALKRLAAPGSRLQSAELDVGLRRVGDLQLDLKSNVAFDEELKSARVSGSSSWAPSFELSLVPGSFDVSAPAMRPGVGGFQGSIRNLRAGGKYAAGEISGVSGSFLLEAGPLFDVKPDGAPVGGARGHLQAPAEISFSLDRAAAAAVVSAPAFSLAAEGRNAGPFQVSGGIDATVRLIPETSTPAVLDALTRLAGQARPHYAKLREYLGAPAAVPWHFNARSSGPNPFLRLTGDRMELRGAFEGGAWKTGEVAADLIGQDQDLLIDASVPLILGDRAQPLVIPVQLALTGPFPEAGPVWDQAAIERIWGTAKTRHASGGALFDRQSVEFGTVSLFHVAAPLSPVRAVVGLGERIQFHAPLAARLAFGTATATAQGELSWKGNVPVLTARLAGQFRNVQGGAFGLALAGFHHPVIEDAFDGEFRAGVNGLEIPRQLAERWRSDPAGFDQFDRLDLSFHAARSPGQPGPGILQVGLDTRVRLMNEILQTISGRLRFAAPPQRMSYQGLRVSFDAASGLVQTANPLLELTGARILSTELVDVSGDVRLRLGGRGAGRTPVSHLVRHVWGGAQ